MTIESGANRPALQRRTIAAVLVCYALLLCVRAPQIIIKGRFWAEEGKVYFSNAWTMHPWTALFTPYVGYLNLPANAATLAARYLMPLELAPYLTISVALAGHLIAPLLLLTATDAWLRPLPVRLGCVLMLLLAPQVGEGLLNTICSQFQLALCCSLILALEIPPGRSRFTLFGLLFVAPLCGLVSIALLPLYFARAWADRSRPRFVQGCVLSAGAIIQLSLFFRDVPGRIHALQPLTALCVITLRYLDAPFLGLGHAASLADLLHQRLPHGHVPRTLLYLPVIAFGLLLFITLHRRRARPAFWLLAGGGAIGAFTYLGAIGGGGALVDSLSGERYVFVPQTLFGLTLLSLAAVYHGWTQRLCAFAVLWLLAVGAHAYARPWAIQANGPPWRREIALWRVDPSHAIKLWPAGWTMTLAKYPR